MGVIESTCHTYCQKNHQSPNRKMNVTHDSWDGQIVDEVSRAPVKMQNHIIYESQTYERPAGKQGKVEYTYDESSDDDDEDKSSKENSPSKGEIKKKSTKSYVRASLFAIQADIFKNTIEGSTTSSKEFNLAPPASKSKKGVERKEVANSDEKQNKKAQEYNFFSRDRNVLREKGNSQQVHYAQSDKKPKRFSDHTINASKSEKKDFSRGDLNFHKSRNTHENIEIRDQNIFQPRGIYKHNKEASAQDFRKKSQSAIEGTEESKSQGNSSMNEDSYNRFVDGSQTSEDHKNNFDSNFASNNGFPLNRRSCLGNNFEEDEGGDYLDEEDNGGSNVEDEYIEVTEGEEYSYRRRDDHLEEENSPAFQYEYVSRNKYDSNEQVASKKHKSLIVKNSENRSDSRKKGKRCSVQKYGSNDINPLNEEDSIPNLKERDQSGHRRELVDNYENGRKSNFNCENSTKTNSKIPKNPKLQSNEIPTQHKFIRRTTGSFNKVNQPSSGDNVYFSFEQKNNLTQGLRAADQKKLPLPQQRGFENASRPPSNKESHIRKNSNDSKQEKLNFRDNLSDVIDKGSPPSYYNQMEFDSTSNIVENNGFKSNPSNETSEDFRLMGQGYVLPYNYPYNGISGFVPNAPQQGCLYVGNTKSPQAMQMIPPMYLTPKQPNICDFSSPQTSLFRIDNFGSPNYISHPQIINMNSPTLMPGGYYQNLMKQHNQYMPGGFIQFNPPVGVSEVSFPNRAFGTIETEPVDSKTERMTNGHIDTMNMRSHRKESQRGLKTQDSDLVNVGVSEYSEVKNEESSRSLNINSIKSQMNSGDQIQLASVNEVDRPGVSGANNKFLRPQSSGRKLEEAADNKESTLFVEKLDAEKPKFESKIADSEKIENNEKTDSQRYVSLKFELDFNEDEQGNKKSLAEAFLQKRKIMIEKLKEKQSFREAEKEERERVEMSPMKSPNSTKRTKEDILKSRREMMEYGKNLRKTEGGTSQQENPLKPTSLSQEPKNLKEFTFAAKSLNSLKKPEPNPELLDRLASGTRAKISKKEMLELTNKKYQQLPEIKRKKEEEERKEKLREEHEKRKEKVRELQEKIRGKTKK